MPLRRPSTGPAPLRNASLLLLRVCALASVGLTIYTGRHNHSIVLIALFVVWVVSPFFGLILAERTAERSPAPIAAAIYAASLVLSLCPVLVYSIVAVTPPLHGAAFSFLAVPAATWLAIATLLIATRIAGKP